MDLLTQGILGSALAQSGAKSNEIRLATFIGFGAGLLADADVFIRSSTDTLLSIEYHRHFTHSIFFIPLGALIAALIFWPMLKNKLTFKRLYWFTFLGYSFSGFIDACTSYGTYLLWPLSNERIAFHIIAIVDPIFTIALIIAVVVAFKKRQSRAAIAGLSFAVFYLLLATAQMFRAEQAIANVVKQRGHTPDEIIAKPTIGNILLWRTVYRDTGRIYADAVRTGIQPKVYQGDSILVFDIELDTKNINNDTTLYNDIKRFTKFSAGYIALHPDHSNIIGDLRYSIQADGIRPLWGIDIDFDYPDEHAVFRMYHAYDKNHFSRFGKMLMGEDVE